ncbi:MAG: CorA family divalent cation transporter [Promethearchaeota archaeon]
MDALTWCDVNIRDDATKSMDEINLVSTMFKINIHDLNDVLDITERPRFNYDMLLKNQNILLRGIKSSNLDMTANVKNPTIPIGIFFTANNKIVTIHSIESVEFENLITILNKKKKVKEPMFLFLELIQAIFDRLDRVSYDISLEINKIQEKIQNSKNPQKMQEPFKLNSYMIFFTAAMMGNYNSFQAFMNKNKTQFESDPALYEKVDDLKMDIEQIHQFTSIYRDQVSNLVQQTNNMINNNLNNVFKVVGSITLLLSIPTLISGFFGMNVDLPWEEATPIEQILPFYIIIAVSFGVSFFTWIIFRRRRWL